MAVALAVTDYRGLVSRLYTRKKIQPLPTGIRAVSPNLTAYKVWLALLGGFCIVLGIAVVVTG